MLFLLVIVSSLFIAIWNTLNAKEVKDGCIEGLTCSTTFVFGGSFFVASFYLAIAWLFLYYLGYVEFPTTSAFFWPAVATTLLNIISNFFRFKSYSLTPFAVVASFSSLSPVLSVLAAWLIVGEVPTWGAIVGIILISLSLYLLSFKGRHSFKNLLSPFKNLWNNLGVRYAFLSSLPPAISIVFDREAVKASDPLTFSLLVTMFVGGSALLIDFVGQGRKKFVAQLNFPRIKSFLIGGVFYLIATSAASAALLFDISPNVSALKRLAIVFEVILGYFFLQQKEDLRRRLLAGCGVVIGAILIGLFR